MRIGLSVLHLRSRWPRASSLLSGVTKQGPQGVSGAQGPKGSLLDGWPRPSQLVGFSFSFPAACRLRGGSEQPGQGWHLEDPVL